MPCTSTTITIAHERKFSFINLTPTKLKATVVGKQNHITNDGILQ